MSNAPAGTTTARSAVTKAAPAPTTQTQQQSTQTPIPSARSTRRWSALTVLGLAQFLVVLDASIVNIALPSIGRQLALDNTALGWVVMAYVLPFGGLLLLGGRLADRYGQRRLFLIGTTGFVIASALAGLSVSSGMLLGARAAQGASAALLAPAALALVTRLFPLAADRAKALGVWGAVAGIGSVAGVLLGGILTASIGWPAIFYVNIPVGLIVLASIPRLVTRDPKASRTRLDIGGALTITLGLAGLVGALNNAAQAGFANPLTLALLAASVVLIAAFILIERRAATPLVAFSIFRNRSVSAGNLAILLLGMALTTLFFELSIYMQDVLHYDALTAGLTQLPLAGSLVLIAAVVPSVTSRIGTRAVLTLSLIVLAGGLVWLAAAPSTAVFAVNLLGPSLVIGLGLGGSVVSGTQLAVNGVAEEDAGLAGGLINTSQQVGGALGIAILTAVAAARTGVLHAAGASAANALTGGFSWAFLGAAAFALIGSVLVMALPDRPRRDRVAHTE